MHAELCPVCKGSHKDPNNPSKQCYGCKGKGWVEVNDNKPTYPYQMPPCSLYHCGVPEIDWGKRCDAFQ